MKTSREMTSQEIIDELHTNYGYTMEELGYEAGVDGSTISRVVTGKSSDMMHNKCRKLKVLLDKARNKRRKK